MSHPESYSDVILRHYKNPEFKTIPEHVTHQNTGKNTLCGDEITLYLNISKENSKINDIGFAGKGCMICQSSASILCHSIKNKEITEAVNILNTVKHLFDEEGKKELVEISHSNEYLALLDVRKFPGRKKCVLLAWQVLEKILTAI